MPLPISQKTGKILKSQNFDLELKSLENGSFLLKGIQAIRYVDKNDQAIDENILFFQELKVN